ncbi:MAG: hypothetical protein HW411_987 [Gammaproteobacteria bacterium]|nr:hypothetical protein [Gammaproteobacteria bacterium]
MTKDNKEQKFIDAVKVGFEQSVRDLDAGMLSKLTQARHNALAGESQKSRNWIFIPAGVVATACLALLIYSLASKPSAERAMTADDIELISSSDSLELYEELEFYEWLEDYELST